MTDAIDGLIKDRNGGALCLGARQRHRLLQLIARSREAVLWDGVNTVSEPATALVVINAATAPQIELLIRSLHENSVVIIPSGENPAFDVLKSKLFAFGSIGSQGADAPHHLWWGGVKSLAVPTGLYRKQDTLFVSSCTSEGPTGEKSARWTAALDRLGLDSVIETTPPGAAPQSRGPSKIDFIIQKWRQAQQPVFWIAAEANIRQHPLLPQALECDFAVHKKRSGEMDVGALFFHQTEAARDLLEVWQRLSRSYPDLPEAFLLDQAWTLVASQRQIETAWLPDTYWHTGNLAACDGAVVIQCDPIHAQPGPDENLALRCHAARRFGRHQAPEPHLIMRAPAPTRGPITVLIRDVLASDARNVSAAIEAAASAFDADAGGFSHLELVLCAWEDDVASVTRIERDSYVLVTDPSERLLPGAFAMLDPSIALEIGAAPCRIDASALAGTSGSVFRLADPVLGAKIKRSSILQPSLVQRRPLPH
jgi:hypothetical protein